MRQELASILKVLNIVYGTHTTEAIPTKDSRVIRSRWIDITGTVAEIQRKVNDIVIDCPSVERLTILPDDYAESSELEIIQPMPYLKKLTIDKISFKKLHLNDTLTPMLTSLKIINAGDIHESEFMVECGKLREIDMQYVHARTAQINKMLAASTSLVSFSSYKLQCFEGTLKFQSNALTNIRVHRNDCLRNVSIWAPQLQSLTLQAVYDLQKVTILDSHDTLLAKLPTNFTFSKFDVDLTNCCLNNRLVRYLENHPRITDVYGLDDDEDTGLGFGNPMESMWRNMRNGMMGFDGTEDDNYDSDHNYDSEEDEDDSSY